MTSIQRATLDPTPLQHPAPAATNAQASIAADTQTMTAVVATGYGPTDVLQVVQRPRPTPGEGDLLIRVHASNVSAADSMMRRGDPAYARLFLGLRKPKAAIPGACFSGVVAAVGKSVTAFSVGQAVYGGTDVGFGAHAEYVCVPQDGVVVAKPDMLSFEDAALMFDGPATSWAFLHRIAAISAGQKVLINGASGSLGTVAVQLAKAAGAEVTGVCSPANVALVRSLGADHVIDYTEVDFTSATAAYDIIYDTVGTSSFGRCKRALKPKGKYLSPVLTMGLLFRMLSTKPFGGKRALFAATGLARPAVHRAAFEALTELIQSGQLRLVTEDVYLLAEIAEAHKRVDTGRKVGNLVIRVAPSE